MPVNDPQTCAEITRLHDAIMALGAKFDAFTISHSMQSKLQRELEERIDEALNAFPDGPEKHRDAHQAMIDAAKAQERFYTDLRNDLIKWGVLGLMTIVMGIFMLGLKAHLMGWLTAK